jgi:hypothetical protein
LWDSAFFDVDVFDLETALVKNRMIGTRGHRISLKLKHSLANDVYVNQMQVEVLAKKQGFLATAR